MEALFLTGQLLTFFHLFVLDTQALLCIENHIANLNSHGKLQSSPRGKHQLLYSCVLNSSSLQCKTPGSSCKGGDFLSNPGSWLQITWQKDHEEVVVWHVLGRHSGYSTAPFQRASWEIGPGIQWKLLRVGGFSFASLDLSKTSLFASGKGILSERAFTCNFSYLFGSS